MRSLNWVTLQKRLQRYNKKMKNTNNSVKKYQSYGFLLLALLFCGSVSAKVNHYVGGYGQIGEWTLMPSSSNYGNSLGVAGGAGFVYELQAGPTYKPVRFLLDVGVGATYGMTAYIQSSNSTAKLEDQTDLNGDKFDYIYEIQDRKDKYTNLAVQIPLMVGVQFKRFYALAGLKVYANMLTKTNSSAKLTTYGTYWNEARTKHPFEDMTNMPEYQFFTDEPVKKSIGTTLNLDMDLSLEIGARLGVINYAVGYDVPKRKLEYRIGAFLDYGLLDVHTSGTKQALTMPDSYDVDRYSPNYVYNTRTMIDNVEMNDVMATEGFASKVQNLMVGVKFTVLFQMPEQKKCVMCDDNYKSTAAPRGGSRGMKYEE